MALLIISSSSSNSYFFNYSAYNDISIAFLIISSSYYLSYSVNSSFTLPPVVVGLFVLAASGMFKGGYPCF